MSRINWCCTSCGMSSARRTSVQRHIDNPNIHAGGAKVIPFMEYSVGITSGKYKVRQKPLFTTDEPLLIRLVRKIISEMENQIAREVARRICENRLDDSFYNNIETIARMHIVSKQYDEIFNKNP